MSLSNWRAALACGLLLTLGTQATTALPLSTPASPAVASVIDPVPALRASQLDPELLRKGLEAVACAQQRGHPAAQRLGLIDFRLPSSQRRLWVLDMQSGEVLFHEHVAHGRGSGEAQASRFSNIINSHTSSLGLFLTLQSYTGTNGYSMRLEGLESGINDRAHARAIVVHGADYVSEGIIKASGRLGRSYGCPAVRREIARPLIDTLKGGQYLYAYADDPGWSGTTTSLGCGGPAPDLHTASF